MSEKDANIRRSTRLDVQSSARQQEEILQKKVKEVKVTKPKKVKESEQITYQEETKKYNSEKNEAFKEILSTIPIFLKKGLKTKEYLQSIDDAEEDKAVEKMYEPNFYEGEVQYDEDFEEKEVDFGNMQMTYRALYRSLIVNIEDSLRNTKEGKQLCTENIVKTYKDYDHFSNIIFCIIKAILENKPVNIENITKTATYLNVPSINVIGLFSKKSFQEIVEFAEKIMDDYFLLQKEDKEIKNTEKDAAINNNSLNKQNCPTDFQEIFLKYRGDDTKIPPTLKEKQKVACAWYCLVCRFYTKLELTDRDWQDLDIYLEIIKEVILNPNNDVISLASSKKLNVEFIKTIGKVDEFKPIFINYVYNDIENGLAHQRDKILNSDKFHL